MAPSREQLVQPSQAVPSTEEVSSQGGANEVVAHTGEGPIISAVNTANHRLMSFLVPSRFKMFKEPKHVDAHLS